MSNNHTARRLIAKRPSIMAELVRRGQQLSREGVDIINLGPGIPDYGGTAFLLDAGAAAITGGANGYGNGWGDPELRKAVAARFQHHHSLGYDPEREVTITAGASAALNAIMLAFVNPGERVIVFEPFFENFAPQVTLAGGVPKFVSLKAPDWTLDEKAFANAFSNKTKLLLLNTPNNPTGRVFSREELEIIAHYCLKHDVLVVSDEAYEPFTYGLAHVPIATLPGMRDQVITIGSISKVFNVSGWRVGDVLAAPHLTDAIRAVNDLSLGAPTPLQKACVTAMQGGHYDAFVQSVRADHIDLRDALCDALRSTGWQFRLPEGTFSVYAEAPAGYGDNSLEICARLLDEKRILAVPGASFTRPNRTSRYVRFCFARRKETIEQACLRLTAGGTT